MKKPKFTRRPIAKPIADPWLSKNKLSKVSTADFLKTASKVIVKNAVLLEKMRHV